MNFEPIEGSDADDVLESFQDRLEQYNANFDRVDGLLGDQTLLESDARKLTRVENTKQILSEALPVAINTVIELAARGDSESVRLKAAQIILDANLGRDPAMNANDPAEDLIRRLRGEAIDSGKES